MGINRGKVFVRGGRSCNEPGLHEQIQQATNWDPEFPIMGEDGNWYDRKTGEKLTAVNLKELLGESHNGQDESN